LFYISTNDYKRPTFVYQKNIRLEFCKNNPNQLLFYQMLQKIINIGINESQPKYLQNRIRISNIVVLVGLPTSLAYLGFYIVFFPPLILPLLISIAFIITTLFFNYIHLHYASRFVISVVMPFLVSFIHGYAVPQSEIPHYALLFFLFALSILPWLVIDVRERFFLGVVVILNFSILANQRIFIDNLETDYPKTLFSEAYFINFLIISALLVSALLLFILNYRNWLTEKENDTLFKDLSTQNKTMSEQEDILRKQISEIEEKQIEAKQRNWQSVVLRNLANLVQSSLSEKELLQGYLSELIRAVEAQQGAIYLKKENNEGEPILKMVTVFAGDTENKKDTGILWGEGLVGQCATNKKLHHLREVPEGYYHINSGLGQTSPQNIIFAPLTFQGEVQGVLEVAAFGDLALHQVKLLEIAGGNLGAWIFNQNAYKYTKQLLKETQQQAQILSENELQAQESFGELEATQKELQQREEEYRKIIEELRLEVMSLKGSK
jgi:hypothetical protein